MPLEYTINYQAENHYEDNVNQAHWQFLILPEENSSQQLHVYDFTNTVNAKSYLSINGFGFQTLRVHAQKPLKDAQFDFRCTVLKEEVNPYGFIPNHDVADDYKVLDQLHFKVVHEPYLRKTTLTRLPTAHLQLYVFDQTKSIFDNLQGLNHWVYMHLHFKTGVTGVDTQLEHIIENRHGVCQDFTHLFCAIARANGVPTRYISGYLHQGNGYFGDSQMHAWAEAYVPQGEWIGFDPTNDILVAQNHIKVAHGKDYKDCAPLKGVVHTTGKNETTHTVQVQASQQQ
ncbi:transglutaminase family protein [Allomuricauda sp. d1]|uniref:transglutaminase-like domain-containing protein n=1 Tax=Allomuricauda sp. d1 TaxID=3136725 RepID=UPI0031D154B1